MRSFISFCILIILFSASCLGQSDFRPGYIITNNLDTIHGFINLKSNIKNSKSCEFKAENNEERKLFLPSDIYGYRIENYKFYVSRQIEINDEKRLVFLEYLIKGIVDLFYFVDSDGDYYFIYKEGVLYPLTNNKIQITLNNNVYERRSNKYVGMLKSLFKDSRETLIDVDKVTFNYKSLIDISKEYHNNVCKSQECIDFTKSTKIKIILEPYVGYYNSWNKGLKAATPSSSGQYYGINVRFLPFKVHSVWSSYSGIAYFSQSFYYEFPPDFFSQNTVTRYESKINIIQVPIGMEYTMPGERFQPYLSLSFNSQFRINSWTKFTDPKHTFRFKYQVYCPGLSLDLGLKYNLNKSHYLFLRNNIEYNQRILSEVLNFGIGFNIN
jgi:hypothetical protein